LVLEIADLGAQLVNLGGQGKDERPHGWCHLGDEGGRDTRAGSSRHAANVAEIVR
jgi:hypothetical protein